jgi:hypothetical protein
VQQGLQGLQDPLEQQAQQVQLVQQDLQVWLDIQFLTEQLILQLKASMAIFILTLLAIKSLDLKLQEFGLLGLISLDQQELQAQ